MSIRATLEADGEILDLDEITENGEGVQVVAGLTGFGLPPVDVQWFEGAGDGARARNKRVQPRDIDIPLHVFVADTDDAAARVQLKAIVAKISRVVTKTMTLKFYDDEADPTAYKWCEVERVGGGTYVYGGDTDGVREYNTILTIRAGNPYWTYSVGSSTTTVGAPQINKTVTITNQGTATTYPLWTVNGPCDHFVATSPAGEVLEWEGRLNPGDQLIIDTERATAVDQTGENRYSGFGVAPQMWRLKSGDNAAQVLTEQGAVAARTNYAAYGSLRTTTHGWTPKNTNSQISVDPPSRHLNFVPKVLSGDRLPHEQAVGSITFTGLPPQETLILRTRISNFQAKVADKVPTTVQLGSTIYSTKTAMDITHKFTVPADGTLTMKVSVGGQKQDRNTKWMSAYLTPITLTQEGIPFDGDTADTTMFRYDWTGTANQSTSTETIIGTPGNASVKVEHTPRDWQVI